MGWPFARLDFFEPYRNVHCNECTLHSLDAQRGNRYA